MMHPPSHRHMRGIAWMICGTFLGACGNAQARHLAEHFPPFQVVFFSTMTAVVWVLPWLIKRGFGTLRTTRRKRYALRALLELGGWASAYHALTLLPLPAFTALGFLHPLMLTTAAVVVFREKSTKHTWIAMLAGFTGVLLVLRPDFSGYMQGMLFILLMVFCFTSCGLIIRTLTRTEAPPVITFYMLFMTGMLSAPLAVATWQPVPPEYWPWIALIGLTMAVQQFCVSNAISSAPFTTILPFSFCALIFSSVLAYMFFDEVVQLWTIAGGSVILGSAVYSLYFTHKRTRREERAMAENTGRSVNL